MGGRRKIPMKRKIAIQRIKIAIKRVQNRAAAFSKRRIRTFKEAAELRELTGAQIVIIAISPDDKHHVFGHPDADTVIDRSWGRVRPPSTPTDAVWFHGLRGSVERVLAAPTEKMRLNQLEQFLRKATVCAAVANRKIQSDIDLDALTYFEFGV